LKNRLTPIKRLPFDVLSLIPDSLAADEEDDIDEDLIALTHVCRAWREIFISRSSLWTYFKCTNADKTRVYLERSKSSPITVSLYRDTTLAIDDPLFQIIPYSVCRLETLSIEAGPEILHHIITHLPPHAPLLKRLHIYSTFRSRRRQDFSFTATFFGGDLSSLRALHLECIRTDLPWRNMVNLTSVVLRSTSPNGPSMTQLLDFFESTPRLCNIELNSATPVTDGQRGRLVPLAYLKRMTILRGSPSSVLLDQLLIPIGAELSLLAHSFHRVIEGHLPGSLNNLRNISNIAQIHFRVSDCARIELSGPSGQLNMMAGDDIADLGFESLARLDTSKVERLEIDSSDHPFTRPSYQELRPLENLRTLTLSRCENPYTFMAALGPDTASSGAVPCPKLEEIILIHYTGTEVDIKSVTEMAAARVSGGAKLRTIRIGGKDKLNPGDALELKKHVLNVEYLPVVDEVNSDSDDSDEDFR